MESINARRAPPRLYSPSAADFLQPYQRYPSVIQQAILAVDTRIEFINLTRAQKAVLRTLLTRAEAADGRKPIMVKFENASDECGVSVKTITRTVNVLIAAGWLTRGEEARDAYGAFSYKKFRFTPALCDLVALPRRRRTLSSNTVNIDHSFKDQPATPEISAIAEETPKATATVIELPAALQALPEELGVKDTGIAKLRGLAHRAGYDLAHIVACARKHLAKLNLRGNRAFRYLERMIARPSDYAGRAAELAQSDARTAQVRSIRDRAAAYAGKTFRARSGELVRMFEHAAEVIRDGVCIGTMAGQQMQRIYDDIEAGRLLRN